MELEKKKGYHRHHIVPKHMGGDDSADNLIYLTPEEHAQAHLELYELYGKYEDAQAYNTLSSQWLDGRSISGYKQSKEHIEKRINSTDYKAISQKLKGRVSPTKGMKFGKYSEERRKNISSSLIGKPLSEERKQKISNTLMGRSPSNKIEYYCVFCQNRVAPSRLDRHGLDKSECIMKEKYDQLYGQTTV
jgi:hypothetical protein